MCFVRKWCRMLMVLLALAMWGNTIAFAQQYYQVTNITGMQNVGGNSITVTSSGTAGWGGTACGVGPYIIGSNWPFPPTGQASFTFQFATPVTHVKIQGVYIGPGEVLFLRINGQPYPLTNSHLSPFTGCNVPQAVVTPGGALATGPNVLGAQAEVIVTGCIQTLEVLTDGMLDGIIFGVYFGGGIEASNSGPVCEGGAIQLNGTATGTSAQYSWSGPDGFSSLLQNPVLDQVTVVKEGIYALSVNMCNTNYTDTTYVRIRPGPGINASFDQPLCAGNALLLRSNTMQDSVTYQWNGPRQFAASSKDALVTDNAAPLYDGWYRLRATRGDCMARDSVFVEVAKPVQHSFTEVACSNDGYLFDGRRLLEDGVYHATYTAANGCDSVATLSLVMVRSPEVKLELVTEKDVCLGDTVLLKASGAEKFTWGGGAAGAADEWPWPIRRTVNSISVIGTSGNNCTDTATLDITAAACCRIDMPNAFSPNGDGLNDQFGPVTNGHFKNYTLSIYDRWGRRIFTGYTAGMQWDGMSGGVPAEVGTYHYRLTGNCMDDTPVKRTGDLTLIR